MNQPPMKYNHKTRLGNWSEELELEETKYLQNPIIPHLFTFISDSKTFLRIRLQAISQALNSNKRLINLSLESSTSLNNLFSYHYLGFLDFL